MEEEIWKPVPGFEGLYEVSSLGRVKRCGRIFRRKNRWGSSADIALDEKLLSPYVNRERGNYRYVNLQKNRRQHMRRVAVLVADAFLGPRPDKHFVCHNNGVPGDDRLENLRYDTAIGNMADQVTHGTRRRGEKHSQARLTIEDVIAIRSARGFLTQGRLAEMFGVCQQHIANIQRGKRRAYD